MFRGIGLANTLPLDDAVELLGDRGHDVRRLDRDGCVVEEVDQHRDAADAEHDTERDGEVGHELTAVGAADGAQHQHAIEEGRDESPERDLVAGVAHEAAQDARSELRGGLRQRHHQDREGDAGDPDRRGRDRREHLARPFRPTRPEEPDGIGLAGLPSLVGGDHDEERIAAPADIRPGTNQKLAVRERQMLSR